MTTLAPTRTETVSEKAKLPFAVAFGCLLAVSSTISGAVPGSSWSMTSSEGSSQMRGFAPPGATSSGQVTRQSVRHATDEPAKQVTELRVLSGLTTDQVAKLMGVTRRSIHNWVGGSVMTSQNQDRLAYLLSLIRALPADTPEARRATLLNSSTGRSLFHQLLDDLTHGARIQMLPASPRERIAL